MQFLVISNSILNNLLSFSQNYCLIQPSFANSLSSCEIPFWEGDVNFLSIGKTSCSGSVT